MHTYQKLNNGIGWIVFAITLTVYTLTVEPTVSYWDSGEFITAAHKLEIPHSPGAPLFMLIGRAFSLLAGDNVEQVAFWVNMVSVLSSAMAVLFLFWSITLIGRRLLALKEDQSTRQQNIILMTSGTVGSLAFAFSDSFWFSATETEVYALSSFFTAFVFWAILKWETFTDPAKSNRWLILIAFMMGLSVGVHPLNLLTLPCLGLIYYFKKYQPTFKGAALALGLSGLILIFLMFGIRVGLVELITSVEIFTVNNLGWSFGQGIVLCCLLIIALLGYAIYYSAKKRKALLNTALLCFTFVLIGYTSYAIIVIRSYQNPPLDTINVENILSFKFYLNMESFGSRPLFQGPYYTTAVVDQKEGKAKYVKGAENYELQGYQPEYIYDPKGITLLPRTYSTREGHPEAYQKWMDLKAGEKPTMWDNLSFMVRNQMGHMYARYFLWNFAGRQSDVKDAGWLAPWESASILPASLANNKARNNYFLLPLLLGLLGLVFTMRKNLQAFWVISLLFLTTGVILVLYLNSPPVEPRERDYIYVGSYFAFAIWIGLGVLGLHGYFQKFFPKMTFAPILAGSLGLLIPALMLWQNWDDHDRSNRYYAADSARNFLASCPPNAILFTGADNDTYPLWYLQEVEGFRTDVRVLVTTYYHTGWYIDQMQQPANQSAPLPFTMDSAHYIDGGANDYLPLVENPKLAGQAIDLQQYLNLLKQEHPALQVTSSLGENLNILPAKQLFLDVPTEQVLASGILPKGKESWIIDRMPIDVKGRALLKGDLALLDIIATNQWERPICFTPTASFNIGIELDPYLVQEGATYRLFPITAPEDAPQLMVDTERMYDQIMNQSQWREIDNPKVYYDKYYQNQMLNPRTNFNILASTLLQEGQPEKAKAVLMRSLEVIPNDTIPYDITSAQSVRLLLDSGAHQAATQVADILSDQADQELTYYLEYDQSNQQIIRKHLAILQTLTQSMERAGKDEEALKYERLFTKHYEKAAKMVG